MQIFCRKLSQGKKNISLKRGWWSGTRCRPWIQAPVPPKKRKIQRSDFTGIDDNSFINKCIPYQWLPKQWFRLLNFDVFQSLINDHKPYTPDFGINSNSILGPTFSSSI
jgi:hypothetical protein